MADVWGGGLGLEAATDRTASLHLPTGCKSPADLGGAQWVGLGSGREGSSTQAASGRGGRDRAKGGAAARIAWSRRSFSAPTVLAERGAACPKGPYNSPTDGLSRRAISLCPSQKRAGARGRASEMLTDELQVSQLVHKCTCPSWPFPLMETEAGGLLMPLGLSPFLPCPCASAQCQVDQGLIQRRLQLLSTTIQKVRLGAPRCPLHLVPHQPPLPGQFTAELALESVIPAHWHTKGPTNRPLLYHS